MKKKIYIAVFSLLILNLVFSFNNCFGQWEQCNFYNGKIHEFAVSGNNIFAGTSPGTSGTIRGVWLSTNDGQSWIQTNLNNRYVYSIVANGSNIFAGTDISALLTGGVWLSSNNGQSWTQRGLENESIFSLAIKEIGDYIFAGTGSFACFSTNHGLTWIQNNSFHYQVKSLAIDGSNIFAGTYNHGIWISTNNGQNYTQTAMSDKIVGNLAISGHNIFAGTSHNGVWLSTNNGQSWTQVGLYNETITSIIVSGNNIFAGVFGGGSSSGVWLSRNNGQNWIQKNEGFSSPQSVYSMIITDNYIFAGTDGPCICWRRPLSDIIGIQNIGSEVPAGYALHQNYPNPFNPLTKIRFEVPKAGQVKISVFDVTGREVAVLVNETLQAGVYETTFDAGGNGSGLTSGVYFCRMETGEFKDTKRMLMIK